MSKLLVNAPTGEQQILIVGDGGGYFDAARVIWDERMDGPLPSITLGGMVRNGDALEFSQARKDEHDAALVEVPQIVTMRQARLALFGAGMLDDVEEAINGLTEPTKTAARIEWEYSGEVHRHKALVLSLAPALGLNDAQLDALFISAASID
jgi:hypothetical protein